jgi:cytochrome c biogenesis protein CcmG/thiol:disulfide interchange protein DsbE
VAVAYGVYGAPETFFIDKDGVIVEKLVGTVPPQMLARKLDNLL